MDIIRKTMVATIDPDSLTDATPEKPFGGFKAIASDESRDRDQENLYKNEWITPLPDHITIDTDHGMSVATTVGSAKPYFEGDEMWIDASFSSIERAQETRTLILEGHIKTVSVAALVDRSKKSGTPKRELLNVGIVAIPANRNAIIFDAKGYDGRDEVKAVDQAARDFLLAVKAGTAAGSSDGAMVQAIHDAAGHLGAACIVVEVPVESTDSDPSGADDGANKSVNRDVMAKDSAVTTDEEAEAEEYEETPNAPPGAVEIGDVTPEVEASTEKFTTQEIVDAILGEKSIDVDGVTVSADQFKDALQHIISNAAKSGESANESPANSPVEKAAAATDEVPAPADETADDAADDVAVAVEKRARQMRMALEATEFLSV